MKIFAGFEGRPLVVTYAYNSDLSSVGLITFDLGTCKIAIFHTIKWDYC